jgi:hypothetical protein
VKFGKDARFFNWYDGTPEYLRMINLCYPTLTFQYGGIIKAPVYNFQLWGEKENQQYHSMHTFQYLVSILGF